MSRRSPLLGCLLLAAACSGAPAPQLTFYREITAGQLYGLGFEITTVRIERPERGRVAQPLEVAARLAIEQKGASPAHPVEAERHLELHGAGCDIELAAGSDRANWKWLVVPKTSGALRLSLDLSGLPGPFKSCKLDDHYVACESLRQFEITVPIE